MTLRIKGDLASLRDRANHPQPPPRRAARRQPAPRALAGYGWVRTLRPTCGWCGWQPKKSYPTTRRAQEAMQGHEANSRHGCKLARLKLRTTTPNERIRARTLHQLARTTRNDRVEFIALDAQTRVPHEQRLT